MNLWFSAFKNPNLKSFYLILVIALMGAERLNLMPALGIIVQPYYILALPIMVITILKLPKPFLVYLTILAILLLCSALANQQITHLYWKRLLLFYFLHFSALCVVTFLIQQEEHEKIFSKALMIFIVFNIAFSIAEGISFMQGIYQHEDFKNKSIINMNAFTIAFEVFRPTGVALDPNRGAFNYLFSLMAIISLFKAGYRHIALYALSILALSKSAFLATIFSVIYEIKSDKKKIAFFIVSLLLIVVFAYFYFQRPADIQRPLVAERLSVEPGSSGNLHIQLIRYGIQHFIESNSVQMIIGNGFSYASFALKDLFLSKYANYHSQIVTILVEQGVIGFILYVAVILSLWRKFSIRERIFLMAPFLGFQVFYQNLGEPIVIFVLAYFYIRVLSKSQKNLL